MAHWRSGPRQVSDSTIPESEPLPDLLPGRAAERPVWMRALYAAGAVVAFALGVVGWLVPVVTGVPFYVVGLALLAGASDRMRQAINRAERRLPHRWRTSLRRALRKLPRRWWPHIDHRS